MLGSRQARIIKIFCFIHLPYAATREAASASPASARNNGMKFATVAVVPVKLAPVITSCAIGIPTATIKIIPKITTRTLPPI